MDYFKEQMLKLGKFSVDGPGTECGFWQYQTLSSTMDQIRVVMDSKDRSADYVLFHKPVSFAQKIFIVTAEEQTAGRGRNGRHWVSKQNSGLWMTIGWELPSKDYPAGLSLSIGLGIQRALERLGCSVLLKWPNDIVVSQNDDLKKLGGILIETNYSARRRSIFVGIGLNITLPDKSIKENQSLEPISLSELSCQGQSADVFQELLTQIFQALEELYVHGFTTLQREYDLLMAWREKDVVCIDGQRKIDGKIVGVGTKGQLLLEHNGKRLEVIAGDVTIRKQQKE